MINSNMKDYNYYLIGESNNYGQATIIKDIDNNPIVQGQVKLNINIISQTLIDNIRYQDATYLGLTHNKDINDKYIIEYEGKKLKVKYINNRGRYTQVYLGIYE